MYMPCLPCSTPPAVCVLCWQRGFFEFDDLPQPTRVGYCVLCPYPPREELGARKKAWGACVFSPRTNHAGACPYRVPHAGLQARVPPPYVELDVHGRGARGGGSGGLGIGVLPAVDRGTGQGAWPPLSPCFFCFVGLGGWGFSALFACLPRHPMAMTTRSGPPPLFSFPPFFVLMPVWHCLPLALTAASQAGHPLAASPR